MEESDEAKYLIYLLLWQFFCKKIRPEIYFFRKNSKIQIQPKKTTGTRPEPDPCSLLPFYLASVALTPATFSAGIPFSGMNVAVRTGFPARSKPVASTASRPSLRGEEEVT